MLFRSVSQSRYGLTNRCIIKTIKKWKRKKANQIKEFQKSVDNPYKMEYTKDNQKKKRKGEYKMKYAGGHAKGFELMDKLVDLGGEVKVTKIIYDGFNEMEGNNYTVRIKATAPDGKVWQENHRKSMLFEFETNSTWLEDWDDGEDKGENEIIKDMVNSIC